MFFTEDNMLLDTLIAKIAYKIFVGIFALYCSAFGGTVYTPSTEAPIVAPDDANLTFAAIADPQVSNYMYERFTYFEGASKDLRNAKGLDMMLIAGDVAENGCADEYQLFYDHLGGLDMRYIACVSQRPGSTVLSTLSTVTNRQTLSTTAKQSTDTNSSFSGRTERNLRRVTSAMNSLNGLTGNSTLRTAHSHLLWYTSRSKALTVFPTYGTARLIPRVQ